MVDFHSTQFDFFFFFFTSPDLKRKSENYCNNEYDASRVLSLYNSVFLSHIRDKQNVSRLASLSFRFFGRFWFYIEFFQKLLPLYISSLIRKKLVFINILLISWYFFINMNFFSISFYILDNSKIILLCLEQYESSVKFRAYMYVCMYILYVASAITEFIKLFGISPLFFRSSLIARSEYWFFIYFTRLMNKNQLSCVIARWREMTLSILLRSTIERYLAT